MIMPNLRMITGQGSRRAELPAARAARAARSGWHQPAMCPNYRQTDVVMAGCCPGSGCDIASVICWRGRRKMDSAASSRHYEQP